jgi:glycosyltransferase involved in cell wall biosynthesis
MKMSRRLADRGGASSSSGPAVAAGLGAIPEVTPVDRSAPATPRRRRRALAVAYFFPPLGGGGVQRTLKHVKYLPDEGFETIVLTTRPIWSPTRDATLSADVPPGTVVIRAPEIPLQLVKWGLHGALRRARLSTAPTSYIGWPDEMAGWVPAAIWQALRAVRRHEPDVLYSTSSPVSAHLVALVVARITGIPWVADFRDGWTRNPQRERLPRPLARLSARLEHAVVRRANGLVVVDESVELLGIDHGDPRLVMIRNGVDPEDVPPPDAHTRGERFRISYVGALYGARDAAPVFAALRALIERGAIDDGELEVRLVGPATFEADPGVDRLPVSRTGYVSHASAVAEMAAADVLLFYAPALNRGPSGKFYEYLVTGRPVLCVAGSDNFAFELVQELGAGLCAEPGDQQAIEAAIERLYNAWKNDGLAVGPQVRSETLRRFSRPALTRDLAAVFAKTIDARRP